MVVYWDGSHKNFKILGDLVRAGSFGSLSSCGGTRETKH